MENISGLFPKLQEERRRELLAIPSRKVDAVLDTDTFNEIDDQFALSFAMLAHESLNMKAVTAAPFFNRRSSSPADGMEKSYQEIGNVFRLLKRNPDGMVFRGSDSYLKDPLTPVDSEAARRIVELARNARAEGRILYVIGIGAITNVASALLMEPAIIDSVVVWLAGHAFDTIPNREFNLYQDVPASRVIFESGVPLVLIPCCGVAEILMMTLPELKKRTASCGSLGAFLYERTAEFLGNDPTIQKVIWDIAAIACFDCPEAVHSRIISAPVLNPDASWTLTEERHKIRLVHYLERGRIFNRLFERLESFARS